MLYVYQSKERGVLNLNDLIKNVIKVKKLERKIASVCEKKAIQFNNKWKSTDLIIIVQCKDVCTEELLRFFKIIIIIIISFMEGWGVILFPLFCFILLFNFLLKFVMFLSYLNSFRIFLFKVAVLYCVILF